MEAYIGEIRLFAGHFEPQGWKFCHGQILTVNRYQALYSLIGTTYGGDGRSTFALPDFRGRVPVCQGQSGGNKNYQNGEYGGSENTVLTAKQIPSHNHNAELSETSMALYASEEKATSNTPTSNSCLAQGTFQNQIEAPFYRDQHTSENFVKIKGPRLTSSSAASTTTGTNTPLPNMMPTIAIHYIIAMEGIFPTRR